MWRHTDLDDRSLHRLIREGRITWAGNARLHIHGTLRCGSGKRMLRKSRVFFADRTEAESAGYRPCGNCLRKELGR